MIEIQQVSKSINQEINKQINIDDFSVWIKENPYFSLSIKKKQKVKKTLIQTHTWIVFLLMEAYSN